MKIECKGGIATPLQSVSRAPLKTRVGSIGQCKPLPFFGRCYHCNKSNSVARVSRGAGPSEPRGKCLVALSETGANRRWRCQKLELSRSSPR